MNRLEPIGMHLEREMEKMGGGVSQIGERVR